MTTRSLDRSGRASAAPPEHDTAGPPTMADVARKAGVSAMTVSRALRKDGSTSADTRRRIMAAVEELGYVLDQTAGTFSSKRSGFVAVLVPSINNSNFSDTARGITAAIESAGLQLLLGATDYSVEREERLLESMLMRRPEGLIVTGGRHTERARRRLLGTGVPVVETWDLPADPVEHVVGFSNADAMRALVIHLHERGYRRIGFIGGTSNRDTRGADRRVGYARAIEELGLERERIISFGQPPISMEQGGQAIVQLVERWPDTDAAVCVSDLSAFGALMECGRRGWAVPGRIALGGFGDFEVARASWPRLTTIDIDPYGIGRSAGELLLRAIAARRDKRAFPPERIATPTRIVPRETS